MVLQVEKLFIVSQLNHANFSPYIWCKHRILKCYCYWAPNIFAKRKYCLHQIVASASKLNEVTVGYVHGSLGLGCEYLKVKIFSHTHTYTHRVQYLWVAKKLTDAATAQTWFFCRGSLLTSHKWHLDIHGLNELVMLS